MIRISSQWDWKFCAFDDITQKPFLQQRWQFRVSGETNDLAEAAKMLLHEMDLEVAELSLSGDAKGLSAVMSVFVCDRAANSCCQLASLWRAFGIGVGK